MGHYNYKVLWAQVDAGWCVFVVQLEDYEAMWCQWSASPTPLQCVNSHAVNM